MRVYNEKWQKRTYLTGGWSCCESWNFLLWKP